MNIPTNNINILWSGLLVEELIRHGIDYFCISPGSRSTPLTVAVARHAGARKMIIYDERSAAFHALGYARATGKPAVLICTSGTAAANYLPAVIEAHQENLPMIILSADRPPELRDTGANQTIDQVKLFGRYVRWFFDLPTPTVTLPPTFVLGRADRLANQALGRPSAPVHLNVMFREPLAPEGTTVDQKYLAPIKSWLNSGEPKTRLSAVSIEPKASTVSSVKKAAREAQKGLVVIGGLPSQTNYQDIIHCLQKLGWATLADVTSGMRLGYDWPGFIPHLDLLLADETLRFDAVLHLGDRYVSKRLMLRLQKHPPKTYMHVSPTDHWIDSALTVTEHVQAEVVPFCRKLAGDLPDLPKHALVAELRQKSDRVERLLEEQVDKARMNQPAISRIIAGEIPEGHGLFLANSLAVREMDMFAQRRAGTVFTSANRGASGIDGNLSTASGFAAGLQRPVTLLIGDLAFLHDLNALSVLNRLEQPVIVVLINNGGGGIFHWLPIARFDDVFETYFATSHSYAFENSARQFNLNYWQPKMLNEFREAYRLALKAGRSALIEVKTDRRANAQLYRSLLQTIKTQTGGRS